MLSLVVCTVPGVGAAQQDTTHRRAFMLVVHGGAGTIRKQDMTPQEEATYRATMTEAIRKGCDILVKGGTSLDAVNAVVNVLEDSPLFNAGKGAVFTNVVQIYKEQ